MKRATRQLMLYLREVDRQHREYCTMSRAEWVRLLRIDAQHGGTWSAAQLASRRVRVLTRPN